MERESRLIKNTVIYAIGNFGSKLIGLLLLPLYTYYLTQSQLGYYDLVITTISLILPLASLQICDGMYRYVLDCKDEDKKKIYIDNAIIVLFACSLFLTLIFIPLCAAAKIEYSILILIQIMATLFSSLFMQISRSYQKNVIYSISGIISTFIIAVLSFIFLVFTKYKISGLIISNILGQVVVIAYIDYKLKVIKNFSFNNKQLMIIKKMISYSIPLIPTGIGWWIMNVSDRYLLRYFLGVSANGIYAVSNKFPSILAVINNLFYLSWQESSILEYNSKDRNLYYSKMFEKYLVLQFTSVFVLIAFTKTILGFLVGPEFHDAWRYTPYLYIGALFSAFSSFYGIGYQCSKETKGAFYTSIIGALVNLVINFFAIPVLGIQGASISTAIGFVVMWVIRVFQTRKYFKIKLNIKLISSMLLILFCELEVFFYGNKLVNIITMPLSIIVFAIFNYKIIIRIFNFIRRKTNVEASS